MSSFHPLIPPMWNLSPGFIVLHWKHALRKTPRSFQMCSYNLLHGGSYRCSESRQLTLVVLFPPHRLPPFVTCPRYLSHTSNSRRHWGISAAFLLLPSLVFFFFFSFSAFNLLSSPPPFHHWCKAFIHMPAIPDCIPVNRISVTAHTSACRFSALPAAFLSSPALSPGTAHLAQRPQRKNEKVEMLVCSFHVSGALFLVNSRWHHSPTVLSSSLYQCLTYQFAMRALKKKWCLQDVQWSAVQTMNDFLFFRCYIWY